MHYFAILISLTVCQINGFPADRAMEGGFIRGSGHDTISLRWNEGNARS